MFCCCYCMWPSIEKGRGGGTGCLRVLVKVIVIISIFLLCWVCLLFTLSDINFCFLFIFNLFLISEKSQNRSWETNCWSRSSWSRGELISDLFYFWNFFHLLLLLFCVNCLFVCLLSAEKSCRGEKEGGSSGTCSTPIARSLHMKFVLVSKQHMTDLLTVCNSDCVWSGASESSRRSQAAEDK